LLGKIPQIRIGWLVNENHFVTTSPFRNCPHLPTTQCACADFGDFAKQRNGGGREKDLYSWDNFLTVHCRQIRLPAMHRLILLIEVCVSNTAQSTDCLPKQPLVTLDRAAQSDLLATADRTIVPNWYIPKYWVTLLNSHDIMIPHFC
jgi:hypothetical protein